MIRYTRNSNFLGKKTLGNYFYEMKNTCYQQGIFQLPHLEEDTLIMSWLNCCQGRLVSPQPWGLAHIYGSNKTARLGLLN